MSYLSLFLNKKIKDFFKSIRQAAMTELENYQLWLPVFISIGVLIFFALPFDPSSWLPFLLLGITFKIYFLLRKTDAGKVIASLLIAIAVGFLAMQIRLSTISSPVIAEQLTKITVKGMVEEAAKTEKGYRLLLSRVKIYDYDKPPPKLIRISTNFDISEIRIGDQVKVYVNLMPPPKPTMPGGFDYSEYAYFKQIGAIGYTIGKIKKVIQEPADAGKIKLSIIRDKIAQKIRENMSPRAAGIAEGMLIGNIGAINKMDYEAIRVAGLAHIIAISGMHIVVVVGLVFISIRFIISAIPYLAVNFNLKKIAAFCAIILSYGYLLISGSPVSAQRAFIMSALVLLGIILDRKTNPLRSIAWATIIILLFTPEAIKTASLQMSLAACISLITSFEYLQSFTSKFTKQTPRIKKVLFYMMSITFSTVIAGAATSFFVIYHFNQFSTYSVIANMAAIPLSDFFIMPLGIISIILMPLGLEKVTLSILEPGVNFLLDYAKFISAIPHASFYVPSFSDYGIILISFGGLLLTLGITRLKYMGLLVIFCGVLTAIDQVLPDIIVSGNGKVFALLENDTIYLSNKNKARFMVKTWADKLGIKNLDLLAKLGQAGCSPKICKIEKYGQKILLVADADIIPNCHELHLLINLTNKDLSHFCANAKYISLAELDELGTHTFKLHTDYIEINTASKPTARRRYWERF